MRSYSYLKIFFFFFFPGYPMQLAGSEFLSKELIWAQGNESIES